MTLACTYLPLDSTQKRISYNVSDPMDCNFGKMEQKVQLQQLGIVPKAKSNHCSRKCTHLFNRHSLGIMDRLAGKYPQTNNIFSYKQYTILIADHTIYNFAVDLFQDLPSICYRLACILGSNSSSFHF